MEPVLGQGDDGPGWVLVADDTESIRLLVRVNLELEGWTVVDRPDGDSARALLDAAASERRLPSVVVLDAQMEPGDGWSVLAHIRSVAALARLPVVMATAAIQDHERKRAVAMGVDAFLPKPFDPETLVDLVADLARDGRPPVGSGAAP